MLARLRTELREQVGAIHADVTLPPDREQGSEATEQKLHILLYQTDVPEAELSAALSLTGRELAVTVVLSPLVYLLLRSVHNRILR